MVGTSSSDADAVARLLYRTLESAGFPKHWETSPLLVPGTAELATAFASLMAPADLLALSARHQCSRAAGRA